MKKLCNASPRTRQGSGQRGARATLRDDFSSHPGLETTPEFHLYPGNQPIADTSLSAIEVIQELEWLRFLDPGGLQALLQRQAPPNAPMETEAIAILADLLEFGGVAVSPSGSIAVNWGDATPVETFGPDRRPLAPDHMHSFSKSGQYHVVIATSSTTATRVDFCRLILQVRIESGEVTVFRPLGPQ